MLRKFTYATVIAMLLVAWVQPGTAQRRDDDERERERRREDVFGKTFEQRVEEAIDKGVEWLKKQQGIEPGIDPAIFGRMPEERQLYGQGTPHNYFIARTAFPIQALCKSGVFVDAPEVQKAMDYLRKNYTEQGAIQRMQGFVGSTSYEDATVLSAIEAYYISAWEARSRGLQNPSSRFRRDESGNRVPITRWGTEEQGAKRRAPDRDFRLERRDRQMAETAIKAITHRFRSAYGGGGWRYQSTGVGENDPVIDVSATQYTILGLKAATRLGIGYDKQMLIDAFRFLRGQQDKEGPEVKARWRSAQEEEPESRRGTRRTASREDPQEPAKFFARGWAYARQSTHSPRDKDTYGSMTAAAVNALILIRDELVEDRALRRTWEPLEAECNQMIGDGLAWLIHNWDMTSNPRAGHYRYYYYLYTIERLGMLGGIDLIGGRDWYREGAEPILQQQSENGAWDVQNEIPPSDIYNTCYALLFLKRATEGPDRPVPVITGGSYDD
jgi:hypothetical protein